LISITCHSDDQRYTQYLNRGKLIMIPIKLAMIIFDIMYWNPAISVRMKIPPIFKRRTSPLTMTYLTACPMIFFSVRLNAQYLSARKLVMAPSALAIPAEYT